MEEKFIREETEIKTYEDKNLILIIYDIADNKRRTKFFKFLSGYMTPVQKSCFESHLTNKEYNDLSTKIRYHIDEEQDNVRCYILSAYGKVHNYGVDNGQYIEEIFVF